MTIINLRGSNGSGKSTIVRKILDTYPHKPLYGVLGPRKPEAYALTFPRREKLLYLLGPYQTPAGGADCIQPFDLIPVLIEKYAARGDVLFEGVLVSKTKGQVGACLEKWGKDSILLFLETPLEVCIASVQARRDSRGDERVFNPKNLTEAFKATRRVRNTILTEDKLRVIDVSREMAVHTILQLIKRG